MKIQYALMSCNANPRYTEYWPTTARAWLKLGIRPVCLFIPDNPTVKLPKAPGGIIHTIPPLRDVHISIQSSMLRFWSSYLYPNATVIISDIDLVPLSKHFFCTQLASYPPNAYVHLKHSPGEHDFYNVVNIPEKIKQIDRMRFVNVAFSVAKGAIIHKLLRFSSDWEISCKKTIPYFLHKEAKITMTDRPAYLGSVPRIGDELYPSIRLHYSDYRPVFYISYPLNNTLRTITLHDMFNYTFLFDRASPEDRYICAHLSPLPYRECKRMIEHLLMKGRFPKSYLFLKRCVNLTELPRKRIKTIGPWLSLALMILAWCVLRLLIHLSPALREFSPILLADLFCKRSELLDQNPAITRYARWLSHTKKLKVRKLFSTAS